MSHHVPDIVRRSYAELVVVTPTGRERTTRIGDRCYGRAARARAAELLAGHRHRPAILEEAAALTALAAESDEQAGVGVRR